MEFNESKKSGDIIEEEVLKIIHQKYPKAETTKHLGKFSDYDIWIPEINDGIEVKGDYMSAKTGNLVIEVEMGGKPSALSVTKAKYWVFVEGYRYIWLTPLDIYRFLEQLPYNRVPFTGNGDNVGKLAYLVSHKRLVTYARKVGRVEMMNEKSPLYFDTFSNMDDDLKKSNKTKP